MTSEYQDKTTIKTEEQFDEYVKRAEHLIDIEPDPGSSEANELLLLCELIEEYDNIHYPIDSPEVT